MNNNEVNFVKNIKIDSDMLSDLEAAKLDYQEFKIPKKHGGFRTIDAPCERLTQIQSKIANNYDFKLLESQISHNAQGFRKNYSTKDNAVNHYGHKYLLNLDLKDFFPSIKTEMVAKALARGLLLTKEDSIKLAEVFTYKGYLPQGGKYSPFLSNLVCTTLDKKLDSLCRRYKAYYTRYADDISISWNDAEDIGIFYNKKEKKVSKYVSKLVEQAGFTINDKKTFYSGVNGHKEVTGIIINEKLNVPKDYYYRLRSMVNDCLKHGVEEAAKHYCEKKQIQFNESKIDEFLSVIKGMMAYYSMISNDSQNNGKNDRYINLAKKVNKILGEECFTYSENITDLIIRAENGDVNAMYQIGIGRFYKTRQPSNFSDDERFNRLFWLKTAAINGHKQALKALITKKDALSYKDERERFINRCDSIDYQTKIKLLYNMHLRGLTNDATNHNDPKTNNTIFKLLEESYENKEFYLLDKLAEFYLLGKVGEPNLDKAKEVIEFGAKNNNYYCRAMLINHEFITGNEKGAMDELHKLNEEYEKVNKMSKQRQYLYFKNKGFTFYQDGLEMLFYANNSLKKYKLLNELKRINDDNVDEILESLHSDIRYFSFNDHTGLVNLELAKLYLEGKFVKRSYEEANLYISRIDKQLEYMPEKYKKLYFEYKETIDKELKSNKPEVKNSIDTSYFIREVDIPNKTADELNL